ncbi:MAG: hypothetical protein EOP58_03485 [Sphingomonadales bacterium]|nr:MAG: hypothetical protein EOP58_03485 [Sphingomonadales bacterium]
MIRSLLPVFALLSAVGPTTAQTRSEQVTIDAAMRRAHLMYWYDQAAWHGTDAMLANGKEVAGRIGGWIVDGPAEQPLLIFYSKGTDPAPVYIARFRDGRLVEGRAARDDERSLITPARKRLIDAVGVARDALQEARLGRCSDKPYNTIVLPPDVEGGPVRVYFMTPQTATDTIPFGGHYLIEVDSAGGAAPIRKFTTSCISVPTKQPDEAKSLGLVITHLLDPVPTEIHGFSAMAARVPVFVGTRDKRIWGVEPTATGPTVRLVQEN